MNENHDAATGQFASAEPLTGEAVDNSVGLQAGQQMLQATALAANNEERT